MSIGWTVHAQAIAAAISDERAYVPIGGPDILTQGELAHAAFAALGKTPKITHLPDGLRRLALRVLPHVTPKHIHGPALFFLSAPGMDMIGTPHGSIRIADHFARSASSTATSDTEAATIAKSATSLGPVSDREYPA